MKQNQRTYIPSKTLDAPVMQLDTRSKILRSAITVFAEFGYDSSSLRQITALAGVNHGSVKYHYSNKEELWRSSVKFLYAQLEESLDLSSKIWEKMSARDQIETGTRIYIRFLAKNPELFRITMFETLHNSPRLDWLTENVTIPYTERSLDMIRKNKNLGIYPAHIPDMNLFYLSMAACRYLFLVAPEAARVFGKDVTSEQEVQRHEDAVVELFFGHLSVAEQSGVDQD